MRWMCARVISIEGVCWKMSALLACHGGQTPGVLRRHDIPQEAFDRALRVQGLRGVSEVKAAHLEPNEITVIKYTTQA